MQLSAPIIVLGNPRSGTSLLRSVINSHDQVVVPPECGFIQWLYHRYRNFDLSQLNAFLDDLLVTKKIEGWKLDRESLLHDLKKHAPVNYSELCATVYWHYGSRVKSDLRYWGDKNNYYIQHLPLLYELYPGAHFVHTIRNPKDVACSYLQVASLPDSAYKPRLPTDVLEIVEQWYENNTRIAEFFVRNKASYFQMQHEDLLRTPEVLVAQIFERLNLDGSDVLANYASGKYRDEPAITLAWKKKLLGPIDASGFDNSSGVLSLQEDQAIDEYLDSLQAKFSYTRF